jgi:hypothetical protein
VVYKVAPPATSGGTWQEAVIYAFYGTNGSGPTNVAFLNGNLVGASGGGSNGMLFELSPPVSGNAWTLTAKYDFDGTDGAAPQGAVVNNCLVYGVAGYGATGSSVVNGSIFQWTP